MGRYTLLFGLLFFLCTFSNAHVVINSLDYEDVASGVFYANALGDTNYYIYPSTNLQTAVLQVGPTDVVLIESETSPVHASYQSALQNNGATITEHISSSSPASLNLELAERSGTHTFIVTDPDYSYNLVVLFPYAKASGSYVLFASKENAGDVANFLTSSASAPTLVYGTVDDEVLNALGSNNVAFTQIENGDKYLDNIGLAEEYFANYNAQKQVTFTDGTFFEPSITDGVFPIILISNTIPTETYDFLYSKISNDELGIGVLIKDDYTSAIYNLMKKLNNNFEEKKFSVFVKMGQTGGAGGEVNPLSSYPLPGILLDIGLQGTQYNTAKEEVELILENKGTVATYATSSLNIYSDNKLIGTVGDSEPQFISKGETKGFSYPLILENPGKLTANITTYFSSSKYAFERAFNLYVDLGVVDFSDASSIDILTATYSPDADAVSAKYSNPGTKNVYFRTSINYSTDFSSSTIEDSEVRMLEPGQSTVVRVGGLLIAPEELTSLKMSILTEYGGREEFLINQIDTPVEVLEPQGIALDMNLAPILLAIIILVAIAYFLIKKKKKSKPITKKKG